MTSLSVGIVGLPNVGKSTLFNALLSKQQAFAANYPFATIEPNVGIVPVPDERLPKLAEIVKTEKIVPATVTFLDIAGLVKGASTGEGLGNKFLSHIREASVILHVVRAFADSNVVQTGSGDSVEDYLTIETELQLADLSTLEKQNPPSLSRASEGQGNLAKLRWAAVEKLRTGLESGRSARQVDLSQEESEASRDLFLLTSKPQMWVLNVDETGIVKQGTIISDFVERVRAKGIEIQEKDCVVICAKLEEELSGFDAYERLEYLKSAGLMRTGLENLISAAYTRLGLMSYLTAGEKEVRAWTVPVGTVAPEAAGVIHTDFIKHFITARVCSYVDFVEYQGWKGAAEKGKVRQEGREYVVQEGDVIEFMIGK